MKELIDMNAIDDEVIYSLHAALFPREEFDDYNWNISIFQ